VPLYDFQHPETGEIIEVCLSMKEDKSYVDEDGVEWSRLFSIPNASIDTEIDPYSSRDFKKVTENKKGSYGDMLDRSREMSEKRKAKDGKDPVQQKWFKNWSKKRGGRKHPKDR
jgi:hypothetical protein